MKKIYTTILAGALAVAAWAQTTPDQMVVTLKNGTVTTYQIDDIQDITFVTTETPDDPTTGGAYVVTVPTSFTDSYVKKVMAGGQQVAEIAYEYIKSEGKQVAVAYPMNADGKADLTQGLSLADGGSVVWDTSANTVVYTAGDAAVSELYIVDGALQTAAVDNATAATIENDVIVDERAGVTKTYKIVKIGTQYWMAENLQASAYTDGTAITLYSSTQATEWKATTAGARHIISDNAENAGDYFGYMYNGYAAVAEGIAPEGWEVPTYNQYLALRTYVTSTAALYKSATPGDWNEGYEGTNLSGFSAIGAGYFLPATGSDGDQGFGSDVYFWTSTSEYDALSRANAIVPVRLTATGRNFVVSNLSLHGYEYGHYIRCIRK